MAISQIPRFAVTIDGETVDIGTAAELSVALDVLNGQRDREVLIQLLPYLGRIFPRARDFLLVMKSLAIEDQRFLIEALGPQLAAVVRTAPHLRELLAATADQQVELALLQTLGSAGLRSLIHTAAELAEALQWVYGQCDAVMLELLGLDYVGNLCRQAADLSAILRSLAGDLQGQLLEHLGWEATLRLVRTGRDLADLLRALPERLSRRLLQHYTRESLQALIANQPDWEYLYNRLEPAEAAHVTRLLGLR